MCCSYNRSMEPLNLCDSRAQHAKQSCLWIKIAVYGTMGLVSLFVLYFLCVSQMGEDKKEETSQ